MLKFDRKKIEIAIIIISIGIALRIALLDYPNIEPVLPLALLAGYILGRWYALIVPLVMMLLSDWIVYVLNYGELYTLEFIIGLTFFTWSGMVIAGYIGQQVKPRLLLRMGNLAVFTGIGLVTVLVYDAWTMIGWWLIGVSSWELILAGQVTFTIYHILSTLIFVPLFGTGYLYIKEYGIPDLNNWKKDTEAPDEETQKAFYP